MYMGFGSLSNYNGSLDDVRIYNRALTANEITSQYESGRPTHQLVPTGSAGNKVYSNGSTGFSRSVTPIDQSVVGYWDFDADSGSTSSTDKTANGNNGTMYSATTPTNLHTSAGKFKNAASFDGVNDYVKVATGLDTTGNTVSFWFKQSASGNRGIVETVTTNTIQSSEPYLYVSTVGGTLSTYANGGVPQYSTVSTHNLNTWYHLVIVRTATTENTYFDGVLKVSNKTLSVAGTNQQLNLGIGYHGYLNGSIDDVRVYNRALSASEVLAIYNATR